MISQSIVDYCAAEVQRQQDTPEHVAHMVRAWDWALERGHRDFMLEDILTLGHLVKPSKNDGSWRACWVQVGPDICPAPAHVPALMKAWYATVKHSSLEENYIGFLKVHPFADGNGRTAKIILNWLAGTLAHPQTTEIPNPWGISNP